jgi:hypothetical protein
MNLVDGYPSFGPNGTSDRVNLSVEYPESLSRGLVIVRLFFGAFYVGLPHGFCLIFRMIATQILAFLAWWVVLFTGNYPGSWHEFNVGTLRWLTRVSLYNEFMTDTYPPFSGLEDEPEQPEAIADDSKPVPPAQPPAAESTAPEGNEPSDTVG